MTISPILVDEYDLDGLNEIQLWVESDSDMDKILDELNPVCFGF